MSFFIGLLFSAIESFIFMKLWGWFLVPVGVVSIGFFHAWGLRLLVYCVNSDFPKKPEELEGLEAKFIYTIRASFYIIMFVFGYVCHLLMG